MKMKAFVLTFIILLLPLKLQLADIGYPQDKLTYFGGKPKSIGIDWYINNSSNQKQFIKDFEEYVKDTIYNDIFFKTIDFKKYFKKEYNANTLAFNVIFTNMGCEITIDNQERYAGFDYNQLKSNEKEYYSEYDYFLHATIMHEIMHYYFYQCVVEMQRIWSIHVNEYYYGGILTFPNTEMQYGSKFIEEGICQYIIYHYNESPQLKNNYTPKSKSEIVNNKENFEILYGYSSMFVKEYLDKSIEQYGRIKPALFNMLSNRPPTYQEILNPKYYFDRLDSLTFER